MPSARSRLIFRIVVALILLLLLFYVGRPLYWKISATVHDIRTNKQTVSGGISQFVYDAQKSVGWILDESDSGGKAVAARRFLQIRQVAKGLFNSYFKFSTVVSMYRNGMSLRVVVLLCSWLLALSL